MVKQSPEQEANTEIIISHPLFLTHQKRGNEKKERTANPQKTDLQNAAAHLAWTRGQGMRPAASTSSLAIWR